MKYMFLASILFITGCSSTGVVPMGENMYSISKTSFGCDLVSAGGVKADIYKEMNEFCNSKNLNPELVTIEALDGAPRRCASATVEFRCVRASNKNLSMPSGEKPDRDINRNPLIPTDRGQYGNKNSGTMTINTNLDHRNQNDIYTELKKLKELLDSHTITQGEFDEEKKKIFSR